jgi:hypothetical protein
MKFRRFPATARSARTWLEKFAGSCRFPIRVKDCIAVIPPTSRPSNVLFQQTTDLVEKLRAQNVAFEELIIPDEIHDLLRWNDWVRAYRATAEFFDRRLAASGERQ